MQQNAQTTVEILGPCTQDVRDCEVMRAAIVLNASEADNERAQAIRQGLLKVACGDCVVRYLADIE